MNTPRKAMVLAAGYGTRLRPLSRVIPKPALPVLNRPLLHHVFDWIAAFGIRLVAVNLHYLPERVIQAAESWPGPDLDIRFSHEEGEILQTAGPLAVHREFFRNGGTFLLVNGKIVTDIDLQPALDYHRRNRNLATLILVPNRPRQPFSHVEVGSEGEILGFRPFADVADSVDPLMVFTGIHLLEPEVLNHIPDGRPWDTVADLYPELLRRGGRVRAWVAAGRWLEFSTLERYLGNSLLLLAASGTDHLEGQGCAWGTDGYRHNTIVGNHCRIGAGARITNSILLDGCRIGAGACLDHCIIGEGGDVPAGANWERRVVMPATDQPSGRSVPGMIVEAF